MNAIGVVLINNGEEVKPNEIDDISPGGNMEVLSAPVTILFKGQVEAEENVTYYSEWRFDTSREFNDGRKIRSEENTEWDFDESGVHFARFTVTFYNENGEEITTLSTESDGDLMFRISESFLKVPNAFSPNGDGINDIFKVSHQSLIKFNAYVFNRWGKELYRWGLGNIDEGWDGTSNGKPVKDGVYFIVIDAEGSDGVKYKHKGDINILRGYSGTGSTPNTGE